MLPELFSWWVEQMRDCFAPLLRRVSESTPNALILKCGTEPDDPWRLVRRRNGTRDLIAQIPSGSPDSAWRHAFAARDRREPVVIALARPFLLRRATFPIAAAANLDSLLIYEMDRLTPFPGSDVLSSYVVRSRDPASGTLQVDVAVVPKAWLQEPLKRLAAQSIRPVAVEAPVEPDAADDPFDDAGARPMPSKPAMSRIPLDQIDPATRGRERIAARALSAACFALAAGLLAVPLVRQSLALARADDLIAELRPRVDQVAELRRRIVSGSAGVEQIAAARERATSVLRVFGALTDLLPDDTWLTSMSLHNDRLIIEGRSGGATKLIATLAADPTLKNPSFAAPVVRDENGADVFTIQARYGS